MQTETQSSQQRQCHRKSLPPTATVGRDLGRSAGIKLHSGSTAPRVACLCEKAYPAPLRIKLYRDVCEHSTHFVEGQICCGQHCKRPCARRLTYAFPDHSVGKRVRRLGHLLSHASYPMDYVALNTMDHD